ncbi:TPA: hypothetical protein N0F65_008556 [Lagenidium giganteum]|uniref:Uncharacterized protein n=1 Tax=Lagenidium giganteum TaxID=4803 RepID=A0AAV2YMH8_9STRA|nr:TPA: hypothetical protein N0F65_008556 [Lagenidium giganteum]
MPNTDKVVYWSGLANSKIQNDAVFQKFQDPTEITAQYVPNFAGWNYSVDAIFIAKRADGHNMSRSTSRHRISTEPKGDVDLMAYTHDPN